MRHDLTMMQIGAVRTMLADMAADDDERLLLDTLEGETDAFELVRRLLDGIERDEGDAEVLADQIAQREARMRRCKERNTGRREAISAIMQCAGLKKLPLPEATLTLRDLKPKLAIVSDDAVPEQYQVVKRTPDKKAINTAFEAADNLPNWLTRMDAGTSLTIRRA